MRAAGREREEYWTVERGKKEERRMGERRQRRMGGKGEGGRKEEGGKLDGGGRVGRTKGFRLSLT